MTIYLKTREPIHQARQYQPSVGYESSAESLEAWVTALALSTPAYVTVTADSTGFSIEIDTDGFGIYTVEGVVGDWIVMEEGAAAPKSVKASDLRRVYVDAAV